MEPKIIDMDAYRTSSVGVFSGRQRGRKVRSSANIPEKDQDDNNYMVNFPSDVYHVASSFFLGMFGDSVRALGEEEFRGKYCFNGPPSLDRVVRSGIEEAMKEDSPLSSNQ